MIGGKVIEIEPDLKRFGPGAALVDCYRVWCVDQRGDEGAIYIARDELPSIGDELVWHSGRPLWTPADRRFVERPLRRLGYNMPADRAA
jgi:hypothetical protein